MQIHNRVLVLRSISSPPSTPVMECRQVDEARSRFPWQRQDFGGGESGAQPHHGLFLPGQLMDGKRKTRIASAKESLKLSTQPLHGGEGPAPRKKDKSIVSTDNPHPTRRQRTSSRGFHGECDTPPLRLPPPGSTDELQSKP